MRKYDTAEIVSESQKTPPPKQITSDDYFVAIRSSVLRHRSQDAYDLVQQAMARYADDPFFLSYFGYLEAVLHKRYQAGIDACDRAISIFEQRPKGYERRGHAILYLNLGKAYLASGRKKEGIEALHAGLKFDKPNGELWSELQGLGIRRKNPVPFLTRSHPINQFFGKMMRKNTQPVEK